MILGSRVRAGDVTMEAEVGVMAFKMQEGTMSQGMQKALEAGSGRKWTFP